MCQRQRQQMQRSTAEPEPEPSRFAIRRSTRPRNDFAGRNADRVGRGWVQRAARAPQRGESAGTQRTTMADD
eukprot:COSAG04_NODE_30988_length_259_cov_0.925000_1_plen_71_part_10